MKRPIQMCCSALACCLTLGASPVVLADQAADHEYLPTLIRQTIPHPHAVARQPLTSDRLSTTSTRYIDARRGFRPYSAVHREHCTLGIRPSVLRGYDDNFGISRPEDRPFGFSQRTPRTSVTKFTNAPDTSGAAPGVLASPTTTILVIRDERDGPAHAAAPQAPQRVRIHNDPPILPVNSGAVLIMADGTVIQVGD